MRSLIVLRESTTHLHRLIFSISAFLKKPLQARSSSYDLVLNGYEIASGSQRIHDSEIQEKIFSILGMKREERDSKFGFFIEAHQCYCFSKESKGRGCDDFSSSRCTRNSVKRASDPIRESCRAHTLLISCGLYVLQRLMTLFYIFNMGSILFGPKAVFRENISGSSKEPFPISLDQTLYGFKTGVLGMKIGEKRRIFIPWDYHYDDFTTDDSEYDDLADDDEEDSELDLVQDDVRKEVILCLCAISLALSISILTIDRASFWSSCYCSEQELAPDMIHTNQHKIYKN
ncbi:hypothetical protein ACTFIW_008735 [Dictyostelium discoideum]